MSKEDLKKVLDRVFYGDPAWSWGRLEAQERGFLLDITHLAGGLPMLYEKDIPCAVSAKLFDCICDACFGDVEYTNLMLRKALEQAFTHLRMAQQLGYTQSSFPAPLPEEKRREAYAAVLIEQDLSAYVLLGLKEDFSPRE